LRHNTGKEKQWLEDLLWPEKRESTVPADRDPHEQRDVSSASHGPGAARNEPGPVSLMQGKTQGNGKNPMEQICPVLQAGAKPVATRAQLLTGAAPVTSLLRGGPSLMQGKTQGNGKNPAAGISIRMQSPAP